MKEMNERRNISLNIIESNENLRGLQNGNSPSYFSRTIVCEKLTMQKNLKNGLRIPLRADFKSSEGVKKSPDFDISRRKGGDRQVTDKYILHGSATSGTSMTSQTPACHVLFRYEEHRKEHDSHCTINTCLHMCTRLH